MNDEQKQAILADAEGVLQRNDRVKWTIPAEKLYSHQWLWDSCFIAIGLSHVSVDRAKTELLSLVRGQWANGMLPHMIFAEGDEHRRDRELWRSYVSPFAPDNVYTSGITQPPVICEAVWRIGLRLSDSERRSWFQTMFPALLKYHQWLYTDRDPHGEGLVLNIHPYETGLDNTPPWIIALRNHGMPWWIRLIQILRLEPVINFVRRDTRYIPPGQRMSTIEAMAYFSALRRLRNKAYDTSRILDGSLFTIEDNVFNCITIRNNQILKDIAKDIDRQIPEELIKKFEKAEEALDQLWEASSSNYFSRNFVTHKLITEPTIGSLMPLYAGCVTKERAEQIVHDLTDKMTFGTRYLAPSVPQNSDFFNPEKYWQGPTWINTNWMIVDGLRRYGYTELAEKIKQSSLKLVEQHGMFEYFNPIEGSPAGAAGFSWTAALVLDWLHENPTT